jgi:hypothetical protein
MRACAVLLVLAVVACGGSGGGGGGGGGGAPANGLSVSPTSLTFTAADPLAARPSSQLVTGTVTGVSSGIIFIRILVSGNAVSVSLPVVISATQAQSTVTPGDPSVLGSGTHTATITVVACTTDINCSGALLPGSPQTINVTYQIGQPFIPSTVAPGVGPANTAGQVILRGNNLSGATAVTFGGMQATTFNVVSSTEIHATYPATLGAGSHPVQVTGASGFGANLVLVSPTAYATAALAYPAAPQHMRGFVYDAQRQSLIVGLGYPTATTNKIVRYAFGSGAWQAPIEITHANVRDLALTHDSNTLLAISDTSITQLHPFALATFTSATRPTNSGTQADDFLKAIVVANDGNAVVLSSNANFGDLLIYRIPTNTFSSPRCCYFHPQAGGPANGASALWFESGLSGTEESHRGYLYSASTGILSRSSISVQHYHGVAGQRENINPPVFDRSGTRMAVPSTGIRFNVYDVGNSSLLGLLPTTTAAYAFAPSGNRAYTLDFDPGPCRIRAFDVPSTPGGTNPLTEITTDGYPVDIAGICPATSVTTPIRMLVSPGGETAFVAGDLRIAVVPLP